MLLYSVCVFSLKLYLLSIFVVLFGAVFAFQLRFMLLVALTSEPPYLRRHRLLWSHQHVGSRYAKNHISWGIIAWFQREHVCSYFTKLTCLVEWNSRQHRKPWFEGNLRAGALHILPRVLEENCFYGRLRMPNLSEHVSLHSAFGRECGLHAVFGCDAYFSEHV